MSDSGDQVFDQVIIQVIQVVYQVIIQVIQVVYQVIIQVIRRSVAISDSRSRHVVVDGNRWRLRGNKCKSLIEEIFSS